MDSLTNELMQPTDEILWKQQGFFEHVDSLDNRFSSLPPKTFSNSTDPSTVTTDATDAPSTKLSPRASNLSPINPTRLPPKATHKTLLSVERHGNQPGKPSGCYWVMEWV